MIVEGAVVMIENIVRLLSHPGAHPGETVSEKIKRAAHEVQRPVFYSIAIIITAYLPIFTLQAVEGRLFKPMAWTVAFALLGALIFSMLVGPVIAAVVFPKGTKEWHNPLMGFLTRMYDQALGAAIHYRWITAGIAVLILGGTVFISRGIGSEFLPHLGEGAIWVRGTLCTQYRADTGNRGRESRADSAVLIPRGHAVHQSSGPSGRWHRYHRLLQYGVFCRFEAEGRMASRLQSG